MKNNMASCKVIKIHGGGNLIVARRGKCTVVPVESHNCSLGGAMKISSSGETYTQIETPARGLAISNCRRQNWQTVKLHDVFGGVVCVNRAQMQTTRPGCDDSRPYTATHVCCGGSRMAVSSH